MRCVGRRFRGCGSDKAQIYLQIQFLRKYPANVEGLEASLAGEISWTGSRTGSMTPQSMITNHEPILIGLPPRSLKSTSRVDTSFPGSGFTGTSGAASRDSAAKLPSVDLFALPKDSGSVSELWSESKLSPVRGSIIRPKPVATVVPRWYFPSMIRS